MIYKWREGYQGKHTKYDPQIIGDHLFTLTRKYGGSLTSTFVVADARNVESPLHRLFEWDDVKAGEQYRRSQARDIVRSIELVKSDRPAGHSQNKPFLASVVIQHTNGEKHPAYVTTNATRKDPAYREQMKDKALRELRMWYDRYWDFPELEALMTAIEENWPEGDDFPVKKHAASV